MRDAARGKGYRVGYGRPPLHSQFKKGQSGNPKGRPIGIQKTLGGILEQILSEKVSVRVGDRIQRMSHIEALMRHLCQQATKGNTQSLRILLDVYREAGLNLRTDRHRSGVMIVPAKVKAEDWDEFVRGQLGPQVNPPP